MLYAYNIVKKDGIYVVMERYVTQLLLHYQETSHIELVESKLLTDNI